MEWYFTMIKWIDPNGSGIISEYCQKRKTAELAEEKSIRTFFDIAKKMWGEEVWTEIEIKDVQTVKIIPGLHNQRSWKNAR